MKKLIRISAGCLLLAILFSFQRSVSEPGPSWLDGEWKGLKYQVNADHAWQTELSVVSATNEYLISYPDLGCQGFLELQSANDHQAVFIERLREGACLDGGYVIITKVSDRHISFTCLRDENQRLASFSTLEKLTKEPS